MPYEAGDTRGQNSPGGLAELFNGMKRVPRRHYYVLELRDGEIKFTRDKFDEEFNAAFDAALDEAFGSSAQTAAKQDPT